MAGKKKEKKEKVNLSRWTHLALWMPVVLIGLYFGYMYIFVYPTFALTQIEIEGAHQISFKDACRKAEIEKGDNLLIVSLPGIWKRLSTHPWIKDAKVERQLPHRLRITITERTPLYAIRGPSGTVLSMDDEGYILPALPEWYMPKEFTAFGITYNIPKPESCLYPLLKGVENVQIGERLKVPGIDNLLIITGIICRTEPEIFANLKSAQIGSKGEIVLDFHKYMGKVEFGTQHIPKRTERLCKTWNFLNDENVECSMVDLRFDRQGVTIKPVSMKRDVWEEISRKYKKLYDTKLSRRDKSNG